jgi:hypothetical protein
MHKIHLEENSKPSREPQRRLNPAMQEVVRTEVIKLLDAGIIYPISDSKWVRLIHGAQASQIDGSEEQGQQVSANSYSVWMKSLYRIL